jgi:hypothetical protein
MYVVIDHHHPSPCFDNSLPSTWALESREFDLCNSSRWHPRRFETHNPWSELKRKRLKLKLNPHFGW